MLLITSLYSINRDIFEYYDSYSVNRSFIQNIDTKGNYLLTPVLTLKKGEYQVFLNYQQRNAAADTLYRKMVKLFSRMNLPLIFNMS